VSLSRIDPRFVLAEPIETAVVLGELEEWKAGLREVGVDVRQRVSGEDALDLAVAPRSLARDAAAVGARAVIVEGPAGRELAAAGYHVQRLFPRPTRERPSLLLPLDQPRTSAYSIRHWSVVDRRWKAFRRELAAALASRRLFPPLRSTITIGQRSTSPPAIVAAATSELGLPASPGWVLALGLGDELSRNLFHVFRSAESVPSWVIKFSRVEGYDAPFQRDEQGLGLAADAGGSVVAHAPRLLGRLAVDGIEVSVETAAVGHRLRELLIRPGAADGKLRRIERVAAWIVEAARETRTTPTALADERTRLRDEVIPRWRELGAGPELVDDLPELPAVLQHNDVGSWNIVVQGDDFTLVDWESAREHGLPLWDLFYFLADALALVDGETSGESRHRHTAALFRGERPSSRLLFGWTRTAVESLELPEQAVGSIATLCWLHHSLSHVGRRASLDLLAPRSISPIHGTELVAETWLSDPALGPRWSAWRR
jgi:hypothetical protein